MSEQDDKDGGGVSRRQAMQGAGAVLGVSAVGACKDDPSGDDDGAGTAGDSDGTGGGDDGSGTGSGDSSVDGSSGGDESSGSGGDEPLAACADPSGMSSEELLAGIETIVVLMMENRSFDHYFGSLQLVEGMPVNGLTGNESNKDSTGKEYPVAPSDVWVVAEDPDHSWDGSRVEFNDGANDGFVLAHEAKGATNLDVVMGYHTREQLPILYALADSYVLCDSWFCSVLGPTWPNRFFLHLASSGGQTTNDMFDEDLPSIFDACDDAGVTNTYYHSTLAFTITYGKLTGVENISQFFADAEAGTLPQVCFVDPAFSFEPAIGNDDHPPADIRDGEAFISSVYKALAASPQWDKCLLILTYDEHGGFYDHVPPPADAPDERPEFKQLGFRVPSIVIGPQVRQGCVNSLRYDHVSVLSTITKRFGLAPLNDRVAQTDDLSAAIDPDLIDNPQPPISLPALAIAKRDTYETDVPFHGCSELAALYDRIKPPAHLDRRAQHDEVMRELYDWGVKLGAIKPE